jgi:hypothetical protein
MNKNILILNINIKRSKLLGGVKFRVGWMVLPNGISLLNLKLMYYWSRKTILNKICLSVDQFIILKMIDIAK